jgi:hypothetical protein
MDAPMKREANILSDDITERHGLPELRPDGKITTADLAGTEPLASVGLNAEPFIETVDDNATRRAEVPVELPVNVPVATAATVAVTMAGPRGTAAAPALEQQAGPLFSGSEANELRAKWDAIQVGFVDEPRDAVERADNLVAGTMKRLAEVFAAERSKLEGQWAQGENVSTEDLRLALRRYRSFFGRLLSV